MLLIENNASFSCLKDVYKRIVEVLSHGPLDQSEICERLGMTQTGGFSKMLSTLQQSGFLARDYVWNGNLKRAKLYKYRLKDNYLRFYINYIEPKKQLIEQGSYCDLHLEELPE